MFEDLLVEILDIREELTIYEQAYINGIEPEKNFDRARDLSILLVQKGDQLTEMYKNLENQISMMKQNAGPAGIGSAI